MLKLQKIRKIRLYYFNKEKAPATSLKTSNEQSTQTDICLLEDYIISDQFINRLKSLLIDIMHGEIMDDYRKCYK